MCASQFVSVTQASTPNGHANSRLFELAIDTTSTPCWRSGIGQPDASPVLQAARRAVCSYLRLGRPNVGNMLVLAEHLTRILSEPEYSFTAVAEERECYVLLHI